MIMLSIFSRLLNNAKHNVLKILIHGSGRVKIWLNWVNSWEQKGRFKFQQVESLPQFMFILRQDVVPVDGAHGRHHRGQVVQVHRRPEPPAVDEDGGDDGNIRRRRWQSQI